MSAPSAAPAALHTSALQSLPLLARGKVRDNYAVGNDRILVELPGIDDPERATQVVQKSAFLKFQITDKSQALERVIPRLDGIVKEKKLGVKGPDVRGDTANVYSHTHRVVS